MIRRMNESTDNSRFFSYLKDIEQSTGRLYDNYLNKGIVTELDETENNEFLHRLEDIIQTLEIMVQMSEVYREEDF